MECTNPYLPFEKCYNEIPTTEMKLLKSTKPIQYITLAYAVLYVLFILSGDFGGAYPSLNVEGIGVYLLFVLFIIGFSVSWYNKIITGIIFLFWNIGMWILELYIVDKDGGFGIISGLPLLVLGVLFIVSGYKSKKETALNQQGEITGEITTD